MTPPARDPLEEQHRTQNINEMLPNHWYMNFIGQELDIVVDYIAGRLLGGFLGRRFYRLIEP